MSDPVECVIFNGDEETVMPRYVTMEQKTLDEERETLIQQQYEAAKIEVSAREHDQRLANQYANETYRYLENARLEHENALEVRMKATENLNVARKKQFRIEISMPGQWNVMYANLVEFKAQYGHCNVGQDRSVKIRSGLTEKELKLKQLSRWVGNQRVYYNNYILGKPSNQLKPARIAALNDLGFIWDLKSATWNMMYQELCEHKELYNTTRVSKKINAELHKWLVAQKNQRKKLHEGKPSQMTKERERLLIDVGFYF